MQQIRRPTSWFLAIIVAAGQMAGITGFVFYQFDSISAGTFSLPGVLTPEPQSSGMSFAWAQVYLCSVLAAIVLSFFAAKGMRKWCALLLVFALPLAPWAFLLV